jgi:hypothetical protein
MNRFHADTFCALVILTLSSGAFAQQSKVIPAANAKTEGSQLMVYPFGYTTPRVQQVWDGGAITSSVAFIDGINFRGNAPRSTAMPGRSIRNLTMDFGATSVSPATLTTTFASNITASMTTVVSGTYNLPPQPVLATSPSPFDVRFSWKTPVMFSSTSGDHLLMDVTIPGAPGKSSYFLDAEVSSGGNRNGVVKPFGTTGSFSRPQKVQMAADTQTLVPGGALDIRCGSFTQNYVGNLLFSLSNQSWGAISLPLNLGILGAPGNNLYVGMDITLPFNTSPMSLGFESRLKSPIPSQPPFNGLTFYTQAYYLDSGANAAGLVSTHGLDLTTGGQTGPIMNHIGHFDNTSPTGRLGVRGGLVAEFTGILP